MFTIAALLGKISWQKIVHYSSPSGSSIYILYVYIAMHRRSTAAAMQQEANFHQKTENKMLLVEIPLGTKQQFSNNAVQESIEHFVQDFIYALDFIYENKMLQEQRKFIEYISQFKTHTIILELLRVLQQYFMNRSRSSSSSQSRNTL